MPKLKVRRAKLIDQVVAGIKPGERIYDTQVGGFFVERGPSEKSRPSFRVLADMPSRSRTLSTPTTLFRTVGRAGTGPNEYSAKAARTKAQKLIAYIKSGTDPRAPKRGPLGPTLAQAWQSYRDNALSVSYGKRKGPARPNTVEFYRTCFERLKDWHDKPVSLIAGDKAAVKKMHSDLSKTSGERAAEASLYFASVVTKYARDDHAVIPEWPAYKKHGSEDGEDMSERGMGKEDLKGWWEDVKQHPDRVKQEFLLFSVLTGLRSRDARLARWSDVDDVKRTLFVREPKGGPKRAFYLPLSEPALACIHRAKAAWMAGTKTHGPRVPSEFLFPTPKGAGHFTEARTKRGGKRIVAGHDLRRTFTTCAAQMGFAEDQYRVLLNHKGRSVTSKYTNDKKLGERAAAMMQEINSAMAEALGL
jgi:hypothetical protein